MSAFNTPNQEEVHVEHVNKRLARMNLELESSLMMIIFQPGKEQCGITKGVFISNQDMAFCNLNN